MLRRKDQKSLICDGCDAVYDGKPLRNQDPARMAEREGWRQISPPNKLGSDGVHLCKECGGSTVMRNLMTRANYSPYCGDWNCRAGMPRTIFDGEQFRCACGWRSSIRATVIEIYKRKWNIG